MANATVRAATGYGGEGRAEEDLLEGRESYGVLEEAQLEIGPEEKEEISQGHGRCRRCGKGLSRCKGVAIEQVRCALGRAASPCREGAWNLPCKGVEGSNETGEVGWGYMKVWAVGGVGWEHPSNNFQFISPFFKFGENLAASTPS